jgi:3-dehydroquinate dehydratase-2
MSKPIYVLSGPNLNLLGIREPEIYGHQTLEDVKRLCEARASALGCTVVFRREKASALVINPAGYGHTSVAILDALKMVDIPVIECHLSNPAAREAFRHQTYVSLAATGVVSGFGAASYELAVEAAAGLIRKA